MRVFNIELPKVNSKSSAGGSTVPPAAPVHEGLRKFSAAVARKGSHRVCCHGVPHQQAAPATWLRSDTTVRGLSCT